MAQYSSGNIPGAGTVVSGTSQVNLINEFLDAFNSGSEGAATPGNAAKGMIWAKSVGDDVEIMMHTGSTDILIGTVDLISGVFEVEESAVSTVLDSGTGAQPGDMKWVASNSPPTGWLPANGGAVSRTTYAALFARTGTTFGAGNGSTTFNLPYAYNRMPYGIGSRSLGASGGAETHTLSGSEMPHHVHGPGGMAAAHRTLTGQLRVRNTTGVGNETVTTKSGVFSSGGNGDGNGTLDPNGGSIEGDEIIDLNASHFHAITGNTAGTGGGAAHNNMPPFIALLPCIKY